MITLILVVLIAAGPFLAAMLLRVNAVFLYTSVLAGNALVRYLGDDAGLATGAFIRTNNIGVITNLVLLLAPTVITIWLTRHNIPKSKMLVHMPALVASSVALGVLAVPLLPSAWQATVMAEPIGKTILRSIDLVVGAATVLVLVLMWHSYRSHGSHGKKKHH